MPRTERVVLASLATMVFLLPLGAAAQDGWTWPEKPENLQVLPKDWSGSRLSAPMRGFTRALGVRCSHCHVGEEGQPLSTYDFASDDNPNKERAREMLRMLGSINEHLDQIEPSGERINMWCHTCHRGRPRPMTLGEELSEVYSNQGIEAALNQLDHLKDSFYGRGAYNFEDEQTLNELGYAALEQESIEDAVAIFRRNTEAFPESANVWDSYAEALLASGDTAAAQVHYRRSLELDPSNDNAREVLQTIEREAAEEPSED